jgi:hypothetical protein
MGIQTKKNLPSYVMNIYQNRSKNKHEVVPINIVIDVLVKNWYAQKRFYLH